MGIAVNWPAVACAPPLKDGEVHVWAFALNLPESKISTASQLLSADELERANQFRFPGLRERFIAGRSGMRVLLSQYLQLAPAELQFTYSSRGKPHIPGCKVQFNLAHSDELALFAITARTPVGVDVERIRPMPDGLEIARRFFAASEVAAFDDVSSDERNGAFFNLWTRKEAWLKATGDGISESLSKVEFSFRPGEPAKILAIEGDTTAAADWSLFALEPANGFTGAVVVQSPEAELKCFQFLSPF